MINTWTHTCIYLHYTSNNNSNTYLSLRLKILLILILIYLHQYSIRDTTIVITVPRIKSGLGLLANRPIKLFLKSYKLNIQNKNKMTYIK